MIKIIVCNTLYISAITHSQNLNETQNQQPHGFTIKIARLLKHNNLAIFLLIYSHWQTTRKILVCPWPERLSEFRPQVHLLKQ